MPRRTRREITLSRDKSLGYLIFSYYIQSARFFPRSLGRVPKVRTPRSAAAVKRTFLPFLSFLPLSLRDDLASVRPKRISGNKKCCLPNESQELPSLSPSLLPRFSYKRNKRGNLECKKIVGGESRKGKRKRKREKERKE